MSLKFVLSGAQIKHFKVALQSLGKLGSELLVEGVPERLVLRCINTAKSAFMSVTFHNSFFDHYEVLNCSVVQAGILIKNALATFRTQRIARISGELNIEQSNLQLTLVCDSGLTKRYCLNCLDSEILQATVDKDSFPTCVVAETSELSRLLASFHQSLDEITIFANPETAASAANPHKACQLKSYIDPAKGHLDTALQTQLMLNTRSVFLSYQHNSDVPTDVTFNLRDFRALLQLCEYMGANIAIRFDQPGVPLVVEPVARGPQDLPYEGELVLATLMESQAGSQAEEPPEPGAAPPAPVARPAPTTTHTAGVTGGVTPGNAGYIPGDTPWRTADGRLPRGAGGPEGTSSDVMGQGGATTPGTVMQPPRHQGGHAASRFAAEDQAMAEPMEGPGHSRSGAAATSGWAGQATSYDTSGRDGAPSFAGPSHMDVGDEHMHGGEASHQGAARAQHQGAGSRQHGVAGTSSRQPGLDPSEWGAAPIHSVWQRHDEQMEGDEDGEEEEELPATPPEKRLRSVGAGIISSLYAHEEEEEE